MLFEGHSVIVTNSRNDGDPVATREFSAQRSGKVAFNFSGLATLNHEGVPPEQARQLPPGSAR